MTGPAPSSADHAPRFLPFPGLALRQWEPHAAVVFHPGNNSTHLIDGRAAKALAEVLAGNGAAVALPLDTSGGQGGHSADVLQALLDAGLLRAASGN